LASSRAVLMALLLPDPCDAHCPEAFKKEACAALLAMDGRPQGWTQQIESDEGLRQVLLRFIADFANWDNAAAARYLDTGRALVHAAYPEEPPLVVDPFAGGGSIPLEALRLGCETFASDLNPVACLILKVMLEDIPRHGPKLAEELRRVGAEIKEKAERELADLYPKDPDGATPIAYLWARTVRCEAPNCGAEIPLVRSFWLCKKPKRKRALRYKVVRPEGSPPRIEFEIFEPKSEAEVPTGTVTRARATCPVCGAVLPPERVRAQLAAQRGGADVIFDEQGNRIGGARLLAVVTLRPGEKGRHYRLPTDRDYASVWKAEKRLQEFLDEWEKGGKNGPCPVPDEPLPPIGTLGFRVQRYGMLQWGDLFTARQKVALVTFNREVAKHSITSTLALAALNLSHITERNNSLCRWYPDAYMETVGTVYGRQALPIVWDFAEAMPLVDSSGGWEHSLSFVARATEMTGKLLQRFGQVQQGDAMEHPLPDTTAHIWFTDPPYYDAVPYADLSDFFFVWLKRALPGHPLLRDPFDPTNLLTPKKREAVQDETKKDNGRPKDRAWFEEAMAKAFAEGRRVLREDGIGSVVFAHKTTEGWEALLSGLIRGGWTITGSWPIATEMGSRLRARESAALATSVHLVCRPRLEDVQVGDWADVLRELPKRVGDWMERLQNEGIRGADLVFACIGPALEIFSRYSRVETAEGREVTLAEYLEKVWEVVGRIALEQVLGTAEAKARNGVAGAIEEDARLTALFLWTLQSTNEHDAAEKSETDEAARTKTKGYSLVFDVVRRFAQPLGIELPKWEGRIIETKKGIVRLLSVSERAEQLFGVAGTGAVADWIEEDPSKGLQLVLLPELEKRSAPKARDRRRKAIMDTSNAGVQTDQKATTLDRVHAAMLLQASGQANTLRALIKAEMERGPEFLRLANALSALYPKTSEEKRLLDAMLLAVPR
jgi:adenine-specific DNA methylase